MSTIFLFFVRRKKIISSRTHFLFLFLSCVIPSLRKLIFFLPLSPRQHLVRLGRKHQPDNRYRGNRILPDRNERPAPLLPAGEYDQPDDQPCDQRGDKPARGKKRAAPTCATDCEIGYYRVDQVPEASWDADMPSEDEHDSLKKRAKRDESDEQDGLASVPRPGNSLPRPVEYDDNDGFSRARREVLGSTGTHVGYAHE